MRTDERVKRFNEKQKRSNSKHGIMYMLEEEEK